jgi:hypothetical protein
MFDNNCVSKRELNFSRSAGNHPPLRYSES